MNVTDRRVGEIETELRGLSLENYPNAAAVLFRVFVELSTDAYLAAHPLGGTANDKLRHKLALVITDLVNRQKLTKQQASPIRTALQKDSFLAPLTDAMNDYVHNSEAFPAQADLRAHWNSFQSFLVAVWAT